MLSERIRAGGEAAPWVIEEVKVSEAKTTGSGCANCRGSRVALSNFRKPQMLTDEEIMELTGLTEAMLKTDCIIDVSSQDLLADYRLVEAAVLEKLKQQAPVAWHHPEEGLSYENHYLGNTPLYAAPIPVGVIRHENCRVFCRLSKTRYTDSGVLPDGTKVYAAPLSDNDVI